MELKEYNHAALDVMVEKYRNLIDSYIFDIMKGEPETLYKASTHLIKGGGKRLRPIIVLVSSRALGGPRAEAKAIYYATAIEVLHNFSLVHDDIMDNDDYRRGIPTVHKVYGIPTAILAGDLMFSYAFAIPYLAKKAGASDSEVLRAVNVIVEGSKRIAEGQGFDMLFEETWEIGEKDYLRMIYLKTAALIEASSRLGGIASGSSDEIVELIGQYGRLVGLSFQIKDDILGVFGDPKVTGKPRYSDLIRGKKTILVLYAASRKKEWKEFFKKIFEGDSSEETIKEGADIIKESGALDYAQKLAKNYSDNAVERLETIHSMGAIKEEEYFDALKDIAVFSFWRNK
ncbi:MAG: polyprenyl synthetase family protein [Caldisphaeraceae archaeon]|nr:polyprenyl synthetase family protein [Caldisphaeraceae archaeon]